MIVYQLPNGKVVYLTIEQLLALSDDDVSILTEYNYGQSCSSPFVNIDEINEEEVADDDYLSLFNDDDETNTTGPISLDHLFEE